MAHVYPFAAVRPPKEKAAEISAPPYDVLNKDEAAELATGRPLSFLHVSRAEIDLPPDMDIHSSAVYAKAAENYKHLKTQGPLNQDLTEIFYVYSLKMGEHCQTGIVAAPSVDDYDADVIRKHEKTRKEKEDDRTSHMLALHAQTGPVFLTYRDVPEISQIVQTTTQAEPIFDFTSSDQVQHTGWRIKQQHTHQLRQLFEKVPQLYIADGHHRAASASRAREKLRKSNPGHRGTESYNRFLAVIFPASQLRILAYNRVVADLNGWTEEQFLNKLKEKFQVAQSDQRTPATPGTFCMFLRQNWWQLKYKKNSGDLSPVNKLDVNILQNEVLEPLLGIDDPRTNPRIDFVGGIRGPQALENEVSSGRAMIAFSLYPTTVEALMEISDAGEVMPPKSTWFEPKLRDGLFIHELE